MQTLGISLQEQSPSLLQLKLRSNQIVSPRAEPCSFIVPPRVELTMNNDDRQNGKCFSRRHIRHVMITPIKTSALVLKGYIRLEAFYPPSSTRSPQYPSCPTVDETAPMADPMMLVSDPESSALPQSVPQGANPRKRPRLEEDTTPEVWLPVIEVGFMSGLRFCETDIPRSVRRPGRHPTGVRGW